MEKDENSLKLKYEITCENCNHKYEKFETLKFFPFAKVERQMYPGGNKQKFASILHSMNYHHNFGSSKIRIKCPKCGYVPSWNIKTAKELMAYSIQSYFAIPITLFIAFLFIKITIVSHVPWLAIILFLLLLVIYVGLNVVGLNIGEKFANQFFKPNKKYPPIEKQKFPLVEEINE